MMGEMQEPMGVPKVCLKKDFLYEKTVEFKHVWRPCLMSEILRRVREDKESSMREVPTRGQEPCQPAQM